MKLRIQVLSTSQGRDRVTDFVKAAALLLVVSGHCLAWFVQPDGSLDNTLNHAPQLWWLTWVLQILPLFFFIAGAGMVRLGRDKAPSRYLTRAAGLMEPAVLLFIFAFAVALVLRFTVPESLQHNLGVLMVQLTWFLGAYLLYVALAPALVRWGTSAGISLMLLGIAVVDWLRLHVDSGLGWINMVLVWALFSVIGTQKEKLQRASKARLALGAAVCAAAAAVLIAFGPYSRALITAKGIPGISNLAPPTLVLTCAGTAQILLLTLLWPVLQRWLQSDRIWVPVAVFGSRAMQVYLYHMLILVLLVLPFSLTRAQARPLSWKWWGEHALVFVFTLLLALLVAPALRKASRALAHQLAAAWPQLALTRLEQMSRGTARALIAGTGVLLLVQSSTGIGDFLAPRRVVAIDVYPLLTWLVIMGSMSLMIALSAREPGPSGAAS